MVDEEGQQRPILGEVVDVSSVDGDRHMFDAVPERLEQFGDACHGGLCVAVEQLSGDRFGHHRDAELTSTLAGHESDGGQIGCRSVLFGIGEEVCGVAHRAAHDSVGNQVDRHLLGFGRQQQPSPTRLETHQAARGRGDTDRPASVIRVRDRKRACRDQSGRPSR